MFRMTLKRLSARKGRLIMTAAAIVLGVAFTTGTLALTDTATRLFDQQFARASSGVDVVVRDASATHLGIGPEADRTPVPGEIVDRIRGMDGVRAAEGIALGSAPLLVDGRPVPAETTIGGSWTEPPLGPYRLRSGRAPERSGEVVIDSRTASAAGVRLGDDVSVSLAGADHAHVVVGLAGFGEAPGIPGVTVALFSPEAAQNLFGLGDGWSEIQVSADEISADELRRRLADSLGDGFLVATSTDIAAARAQDARSDVRFLTTLMMVLAATSLLVGSFMIANTFAIVVSQRTREFGTLRALGASARQVRRSVVGEALIMGAIASGAGVALGILAASALRAAAGAFGIVVPDGSLVVSARTIVVGVTLGVGVTVLAALLPARRAARVSPIAAMREVDAAPRPVSRRRAMLGAGVLVVGGALLAAGGTSSSVGLVGLGGLAAVVGTIVLAPAFAGRWAAAIGRAFGRGGAAGRLARGNVSRAARRTAATSAALTLGLAVVTFMTVLATSAREAVAEGIDEVIRADLIVESVHGEMAGLPPEAYDAARSVPGIAVASRMRHGHWQTATGATRPLTAVDPATMSAVVSLDLVAGSLDGLADGGVAVAEHVAAEQGVSVGDRLEMTFPGTGRTGVEVVGVVDRRDAWAMRTDYLISLDTFGRHFADRADASILLKVDDGADGTKVRQALVSALDPFRTATVSDQAQARARETETFDAMLGLVTVLLLFAVVVALLGITTSLGLSIVERTHEIGMLRAIGMTRRQVASMIRTEAALVGVIGGLTGVALGILVASPAVTALGDTKVIDLAIPIPRLIGYLVAVVVGAIVAGAIPARRAARMDVLSAVATA